MTAPEPIRPGFRAYVSLFLVIAFFSGVFPWVSDSLKFFDFTYFMGQYGKIGPEGTETFLGQGGYALRQGFLFAFSMIPTVMCAMGILAMSDYYGASRAAQSLFTPLLRVVFGLPGCCSLAFVSSLNSTDAGAAMCRELYDQKKITEKERLIFSGFQFASASAVTNYAVGAPILSSGLTTAFLMPLGVILVMKIAAANLVRLYCAAEPAAVKENPEESSASCVSDSPENSRRLPASGYQALLGGMQRGWDIGVRLMLPNLMLAFVAIAILKETGLLAEIGVLASPLMSLTGVPGVTITAILTACTSGVAGFSVAAGLFAQGLISARDLTVITPALFLVCSMIQYIPRLLGVIGVPVRHYKLLVTVSFFCAFLSLPLMQLLV